MSSEITSFVEKKIVSVDKSIEEIVTEQEYMSTKSCVIFSRTAEHCTKPSCPHSLMRKVPDINEMGAEERVLISDEGIIVYNPANVMPPSVAMPPRRDRRWAVTLGSQRKRLHSSVERSYEVRRHLIHSTPDLPKKTRSLEHVATDPSIIDRLFGTSAPRTLRQSVAEQILSRSFKPTIVDEDATEAKVRNAVAEDGGLNINMYSLSQTQLANSLSIASNMD